MRPGEGDTAVGLVPMKASQMITEPLGARGTRAWHTVDGAQTEEAKPGPPRERWQHGSHCPYSQDSMLTARLWASRHLSSVTSTSRWSPVRLRKGFWPAESTSSQPHGLCLWNRHPATDCHQEMREDKPSDTAWLYASHQSPSTLSSTGSWPYRSTSLKSPGTCACRDSNG